MKKNDKITVITCAAAFALNVALFSVKLYVGLCANSISIYSDAVNNMFDSLSGLAAFICFAALLSSSSEGTRAIIKKAEQFFLRAMAGSEGSEQARYTKIFTELLMGFDVCTDEEE